jgi:flagellar basal-body rod protein FlgB
MGMGMWFESLIDRGPTPALAATLSYAQARHEMIAENIANLGTPGYKARQLDPRAFQTSLGEAIDRRAASPTLPLLLEGREFRTSADGWLQVTPSLRPVEGVLFHDGTNTSLEREMSDLADNALAHQTAERLLETKFDGLRKAIRGVA